MSPHIPSFDQLPDSAYIRESQLVSSRKLPRLPTPLPFSAPTLWRKVKDGTFPAPVKLSVRVTAWKVSDVRKWLNSHSATSSTALKSDLGSVHKMPIASGTPANR